MTRFVVLGTGPSLTRFDCERVLGRFTTIAVNRAWELAPEADHLYAVDGMFWKHYGAAVDEKFEGAKWTGNQTVAKMRGINHFSLGKSADYGSGLQAVRLAQRLGATEVGLLGFDWGADENGKTHFCGAYPHPFPQAMNLHKATQRSYGELRAVNLTPASRLDWFPKQTLDEWL